MQRVFTVQNRLHGNKGFSIQCSGFTFFVSLSCHLTPEIRCLEFDILQSTIIILKLGTRRRVGVQRTNHKSYRLLLRMLPIYVFPSLLES
jgi:hypothetical protein